MPRRQTCLNHKEKGICFSCTSLAVPGKTHCQKCLAENAAYTKQKRDEKRAKGICIYSGCIARACTDRVYCAKHREQHRKNAEGKHLKQYGINRDQFNAILASQGGVCAICKHPTPRRKGKDWYVDHNHTTGKVRGLLCHNCNIGIGLFKESPVALRAAADYLEFHNGRTGGFTHE